MKNLNNVMLTIKYDKFNFGNVSNTFSKKCHYLTACSDDIPYVQYDLNSMIERFSSNYFKDVYLHSHNNLDEHSKRTRKKMMNEFESIFFVWADDDMFGFYPGERTFIFTENKNKAYFRN